MRAPSISFEGCKAGTCAPDQNERSCVEGGWDAKYAGLVSCLQNASCSVTYQACPSEDERAAQLACVVACVTRSGLGAKATCQAIYATTNDTPQADAALADSLVSCAQAEKCT